MKEKMMRLRIPEDVWKRFKTLCIQLDLSMPKQTTHLMRSFCDIQEENLEKIKKAKKG